MVKIFIFGQISVYLRTYECVHVIGIKTIIIASIDMLR
jgi:hypothetical protein